MVKNLPANAGDTGSIPDPGTKIPHVAGQLSLCATTPEARELMSSKACTLQQEKLGR